MGEGLPGKYGEGLFTAISAGFFFVLVGALFVATPNLFSQIVDFVRGFELVSVPNTRVLILPAPESPQDHAVIYSAATQFSLAWGVFQIAILTLRFAARSALGKKAETISNIAFWLGSSYLVHTLLTDATTATGWFVYWASVLMLIGITLVIRGIILAAAK